jgi:DNA polymerase kappa
VGGDQSVLSTANYVARKFGVRSAMPTFIAKKICPQLILFKPDFQKYRKFSDIFRTILREFDENLESHGLDEAYIDIT